MNKKKFLLLCIFVLFACCGCNSEYTLSYENGEFSEKLIISDTDQEEDKILLRYEEDSENLIIDEKNSYQYEEKDDKRIYSYNMGEKLTLTPLIRMCFEDIILIDEPDYIHLKTVGENYCLIYDTVIYFKTDKYVISTNADSKEGDTYKWDSIKSGIEIKFSKNDTESKDKNTAGKTITKSANKVYIRLVISLVLIVFVIVSIAFLKKKKNNN